MLNNPQKGKDSNGVEGWYRWCTHNTVNGLCCDAIFKHHDEEAFNQERCLRHKSKPQKEKRVRKKRFSGYSDHQKEVGGFQRSSRA